MSDTSTLATGSGSSISGSLDDTGEAITSEATSEATCASTTSGTSTTKGSTTNAAATSLTTLTTELLTSVIYATSSPGSLASNELGTVTADSTGTRSSKLSSLANDTIASISDKDALTSSLIA